MPHHQLPGFPQRYTCRHNYNVKLDIDIVAPGRRCTARSCAVSPVNVGFASKAVVISNFMVNGNCKSRAYYP